jgi:hypothetical protein
VAVNQTWATNGVSSDFVTTGGTYVLPNQFSDLEVQFLDTATPLLPTVDYTISKGVTAGGLPCSVISLKSLPIAGRQLRARIKFGSLIEASGYTMSYAGAGLDYAKLSPSQDGSGYADPNKYTIALAGGRVFHTTTDESGDFYVGAVTPNPAFQVGGLTIANGGGSYNVGDTLNFITPANVNSTYAVPTTLKVLSVSSGVITSVAILIPGYYLLSAPGSTTIGSLPTNPISATSTSGGGSSATFNFVWEKPPARPSFRINQRRGAIDGRSFYQSIFGFMTPFILALSRKGS